MSNQSVTNAASCKMFSYFISHFTRCRVRILHRVCWNLRRKTHEHKWDKTVLLDGMQIARTQNVNHSNAGCIFATLWNSTES